MPTPEVPAVTTRARNVVANITWLGGANLAVKPFWLLFMTAACPRLLGVEGFGTMTAALALAALATSASDLGMSQYSLRAVARDRSLAGRHFSNFLLVRTGMLAAGLTVAFGVALLLGYRGDALLAVAFAGLYWATQDLLQYGRVYFRAVEDLRLEAVSSVVEKVVVMGCGLALLVTTRSAYATLAGMAAGMAVVTAANLSWVARHLAPLRRRLVDPGFVRRTLPSMIPLGVAGLLTVVYLRTDAVMIEAMLGEAEAGRYGQAFRILEALSMLPAIVVQSALFPRLSALHHEGATAAFRHLLGRGMAALLAASLVISAAIGLLAPFIIDLLTGDPSFGPAAGVLRVLCWTFPFTCAQNLLYVAFVSLDRHRFPIVVLALAALLNVGLNFAMIPALGILGAALMTVVSEVFIVAAYAYRFWTDILRGVLRPADDTHGG